MEYVTRELRAKMVRCDIILPWTQRDHGGGAFWDGKRFAFAQHPMPMRRHCWGRQVHQKRWTLYHEESVLVLNGKDTFYQIDYTSAPETAF